MCNLTLRPYFSAIIFSLQVPVLSGLFLVVFLGNIVTTMMVIPQKLKEKVKLKERFIALDKYLRRQNREGNIGEAQVQDADSRDNVYTEQSKKEL